MYSTIYDYLWMTKEEISKKAKESRHYCYQYIYKNPGCAVSDIKRTMDMTKRTPKVLKLYKWMNINEISEKTGKKVSCCRQYISRNPDTWTLDKIKNMSKNRNAFKYYINWIPSKEYAKQVGISYSHLLKKMHNWRLLDNEIVTIMK